jgi:large subunit ribosomal protein L34e
MPKPKDRTRKRTFKRTPGGKLKMRTKVARKHVPACSMCGSNLKGTSYSRHCRKTERRPERPFGGHMCHKCTERVFVYRTRVKNNDMKASEVPILFQKYL